MKKILQKIIDLAQKWMRYPKIGHAAKYVCAKSHEVYQGKSPIIRPAQNKKVILGVIPIEHM